LDIKSQKYKNSINILFNTYPSSSGPK